MPETEKVSSPHRLHAAIAEVPDLSAPSVSKADGIRAVLAEDLSTPEEDIRVYVVSKPDNFSVRFTQPGARDGRIGFAILVNTSGLDRTSERAYAFLQESQTFVEVGLIAQDVDGRWVLAHVVGKKGSVVIDAARRLSPGATSLFSDDTAVGDLLSDAMPERVWIEFTHRKNKAQQEGWRQGQVLWSPTSDESGKDIYANMRRIQPGDSVIHVVDGAICAVSEVVSRAKEVSMEPPNPGKWAGRSSYYVVSLTGYREVTAALALSSFLEANVDAIGQDMAAFEGPGYPFQSSGKGGLQAKLGGYVFPCTNGVYELVKAEKSGARDEDAAYTIEEAMQDVFLSGGDFRGIVDLLRREKNVVLQGPPGTGKTFLARRLAFAHLGARDDSRVKVVQFHQSYSYEDFIRGWRPKQDGGFELQDGVFLDICAAAIRDEREHVLVIDEINRGNLSKIFGELLMLIESDKRGPEHALPLAYRRDGDETFYVPRNLRVIGLMNTADRSLAMVDYALRRRFAFMAIEPHFGDRLADHLIGRGADEDLALTINRRMGRLNEEIRKDVKNLGPGFEVGHSYFCGVGAERLDEEWYRAVIQTEVAPLVREYWFDSPSKADDLVRDLLQ